MTVSQGRPYESRRLIARRNLLRGAGVGLTGVGAALLVGCGDDDNSGATGPIGDGPPETTKVRLAQDLGSCNVPMSFAREFLVGEGLPDFEYKAISGWEISRAVSDGRLDIASNYASAVVADAANDVDVVTLTGIHGGCIELFAREGIHTVSDLRGKTVGVLQQGVGGSDEPFLTGLLRYINIARDVNIRLLSLNELFNALEKGTADAIATVPPVNLELRDTGNRNVIFNTMEDPPWSQQFCCTVIANREFVKKNPKATKRVLRAILTAEGACVSDPERVAEHMVDWGIVLSHDWAIEIVKSIRYEVWRSYSLEDSLRFAAVRLNETGEIRSDPEEIIRRTADFRFLNELKKEMAALPKQTTLAALMSETCDNRGDGRGA